MHVTQDPLFETEAQQFARESAENPTLNLATAREGESDNEACRSYQRTREPGIFANEGETKRCMRRGSRQQINSQRAGSADEPSKPSPSRLDDIESQRPGATPRETHLSDL